MNQKPEKASFSGFTGFDFTGETVLDEPCQREPELDRVPNEIFATPGQVLRLLGLGRTYEQAQDNLFHLCFSFSFSNFN